MAEQDRRRLYVLVTLYATLALGWVAIAQWIVPPFLTMENPGGTWAAVRRYIQSPPALFLARDTLGRWRDFSAAVLIALALHLTILLILRRYDLRAAETPSSTNVPATRRVNLSLLIFSLAFLAVTVLTGPCHDYYFYLHMWYEVRQGHDPWFFVDGKFGHAPLNAYGPLFNLFAPLAWMNPLAPKLFFAYAYLLFSILLVKDFTANRPASVVAMIVLTALFWNPFAWVEIAIRGHFDVLLGLSCVGAIHARICRHDGRSGICLALGVLLKYFPVVLLPFLAFDRGRLRPRLLIAAVATIAVGMGLSLVRWGLATLAPLKFAATRGSHSLSIFYFLRRPFSPLRYFMFDTDFDSLAPFTLFLALVCAWWWYRVRRPDLDAACVVAVVTTALLYHTGFPQYQMVPFVVGLSWVVRHWGDLSGRAARIIGVGCYFGWLAAFDFYYALIDADGAAKYWVVVEDLAGLPTFLFGCAFVAVVIRLATPPDTGLVQPSDQSSSSSDVSSWSSC